MKFELAALAAFAATALATPQPSCFRPAQPCWKLKRSVEAFDNSAHVARDAADIGVLGERAYDHLVELAARGAVDPRAFIAENGNAKRDAEERDVDNEKRWCFRPAQPCWKRAVAEQDELAKRWCFRPAQPCWKAKRAAESILAARGDEDEEACADGDEGCANAKRSLDELHLVARAIVEAF
ncbi:clock-controlled pheromone ccg-4 precursor [Cordyceps fumosorosea ARSEF 2679]|uniref:Clock-controlled pheromone ccg-4 n=1 Tax=Cordyceps fumosorosea (strain ARSEF 2679) TaxID=1081104 RepID=A0A167TRY1_CORFA|nr:clock-controlled pheromone ccg-4 precursor [Cordyceps fumosorosea ARSEF 2679]OAA60883.1 clock-controlled pheromone ccg-4 precursor [Cordyceps fumosorosea ARSEF 2679]